MAKKWSTMAKRRFLLSCLVATATVTLISLLHPSHLAVTFHSSTDLGKSTVDMALSKAAEEAVSSERYTPQERVHEGMATRLHGSEHEEAVGAYASELSGRQYATQEHKEITIKPYTVIIPQHEDVNAASHARKHESWQFMESEYDPTESVKLATDQSAHHTRGIRYTEGYEHMQYVTKQKEVEDDGRASPVALERLNPAVTSPPVLPIVRIPKNKFSEYIAQSTSGPATPSVFSHSENTDIPSVSLHRELPDTSTSGSISSSAPPHLESTDMSTSALPSDPPSEYPPRETTDVSTNRLAPQSIHSSNKSTDMLTSGLASPSVFHLDKNTDIPTSGLASLSAYPHSENTHSSTSSLSLPSSSPIKGNQDMLDSELVPASTSPRSGLGYALTFTYFDQLTAAAVNLLSLMCLTTKFGGVRVVEPFVVNSDFGLNASKKWTEQLKFRDINDISVWRSFVAAKHYNQFVSYETFIQDAPRKVLLVQYFYPCGDRKVWNMAREFCDMNGFELVGKVCLKYGREKTFTVNMLRNQIYSKFKRTDVVVLFEIYGGIEVGHYTGSRTYRLYGRGTKCDRHTVPDHYKGLHPSPSVFSDANAYIERYLNGSSYISLMIRLERILRFSNGWNNRNSAKCSRQCLTNILKRWSDVKQRTGINTTFLAIDVGVYGSNEFHIHPEIEHPVLPPVKEFFSALFDNKTSLQEWEDTFSSVGLGRTRVSGYIAMIQKVVAVRGNVLMLVGAKSSSAFQTTGIRLYHKFHGKGQIIELSKKCS